MDRNIIRQSLFTFVPSILVLILVILVNQLYDVRIISMTKDVTSLGKIHPFSGFISSLGIVLWATTTAICMFTAFLIKKQKQKKYFWFFFSSAIISLYLLVDDLFLVHEQSGKILFGGEKMIYFLLIIAMIKYLTFFKIILLKSNHLLLLFSLIFLSCSVVIDSIQPWFWSKGDFHALIEDGTKWLGIVCWSSYFVETSFNSLSFFFCESRTHENISN